MKKNILILALFLGALGIGLFWLSGLIEKIEDTAREAGKQECLAQYEQKIVRRQVEERKQSNDKQRKKNIIWSLPNSRMPSLIERMRRNEL